MTTTQLLTAEDLLQMSRDGFRYELVKGELRKMSPSGHSMGRLPPVLPGVWRSM